MKMQVEWDEKENMLNQQKYNVSYEEAQHAFGDFKRIIAIDKEHSNEKEKRCYCFGKENNEIVTVRFTIHKDKIAIYGTGCWRKGKKIFEKENKIY